MKIEQFSTQRKAYFELDPASRLIPDLNAISWGYNNLLPDEILFLVENSPTHHAIINKKVHYLTSGQILWPSTEMADWAKQLNNGLGFHQLLIDTAKDFLIFNVMSTQITQKYGEIQDLIYQDVSQVRRGYEKDETDNLYYSDLLISINWAKRNIYRPVRVDYFKPEYLLDPDRLDPSFTFFVGHSPGRNWYGLPQYWAATKNISIEIECNNYLENQMLNSFNPSGFLKLPSELGPQEQEEMRKELQKALKGTDNAGKVIVLFGQAGADVNWIPFNETTNHQGILEILDRNQRMILTAHGVSSPTLIGLPGGPSLGGDGNTIEKASQEFFHHTIASDQQIIFNYFENLIRLAGWPDFKLVIQNNYGTHKY
jgi:hypothetical protein